MEKVINAKIKYSYLGLDENGLLIIQIGFDCELGTVQTNKIDIIDAYFIKELLDTLELQRWEDLSRKFARIKIESRVVVAIGNLIDDKWVKL